MKVTVTVFSALGQKESAFVFGFFLARIWNIWFTCSAGGKLGITAFAFRRPCVLYKHCRRLSIFDKVPVRFYVELRDWTNRNVRVILPQN